MKEAPATDVAGAFDVLPFLGRILLRMLDDVKKVRYSKLRWGTPYRPFHQKGGGNATSEETELLCSARHWSVGSSRQCVQRWRWRRGRRGTHGPTIVGR